VACTRDSGGKSSRGGLYLMLTSAQRYEVGKRAAEHTCAMRYFAEKYPNSELKRLTQPSVQRFKNLDKELSGNPDQQGASNKSDADNDDDTEDSKSEASKPEPVKESRKELPWKKQGQPLLLPDELDYQVREYLKDLRKRGMLINSAVVIAAAEGILTSALKKLGIFN